MTKKELLIRKISVISLVALVAVCAMFLVFSAGFIFSSGKIFSFFTYLLPFALCAAILTLVFSVAVLVWRLVKEKKFTKYIAVIAVIALILLILSIMLYVQLNMALGEHGAKLKVTEMLSVEQPQPAKADESYSVDGESGNIRVNVYKSGSKSKTSPAIFHFSVSSTPNTDKTYDLRKLASSGAVVFDICCDYTSDASLESIIKDFGKIYNTFSSRALRYGFDASKIVFYGDGIGGNIGMTLSSAIDTGVYSEKFDFSLEFKPSAVVAIAPEEYVVLDSNDIKPDDGKLFENFAVFTGGKNATVKTMIVCGDKENLSKSFDRLEVAVLPYTSLSDGYTAYERFLLQKVSYGYLEREGLFKKVPGDFAKVTNSLFEGFGKTIEIFFFTLLFALPLGLLMSFGSMSKFKPLKLVIRFIVWIIRGTPLMLQLITIYYVPGILGNWAAATGSSNAFIAWLASWTVPDRFVAVLVAFVINYSCYFSEIYRGGIESMSKGQYEAGAVLGLTKTQVFFKIILMQVVKKIVPPMSNEIITLVKDTSLARVIAVYEIIWKAQSFAKSDGLIWPIFYTAVFYLAFCGILTLLFGYIEKKLDYYKS